MKNVLTLWEAGTRKSDEEAILRSKAHHVPTPFCSQDIKDIGSLIESFLGRDDAIGLAAPQIGISKRIIAFRSKGFDDINAHPLKDNYDVLINTRITARLGEKKFAWEGCLSCPEIRVEVERHDEIKVSALNRNGKVVSKKYQGFIARVVQHEIDHLEGILIVDSVARLEVPKHQKKLFEDLLRQK